MIILKEEINQLGAQITNLATWKLIAVGTFAAVGLLGWDNIPIHQKTGPLLLYSVGYLCAYIDSLYYRRATAIHVIAGYLRTYGGNDIEMKALQEYEEYVDEIRTTPGFFKRGGFFLSDLWPQVGASLLFTVGLPVLARIRYDYCPEDWKIHLIPIVAFFSANRSVYCVHMEKKALSRNVYDR